MSIQKVPSALLDTGAAAGNLAAGSVTDVMLAAGAAAANLGTGGVGTTQLADGSVTPVKLSQPLTQGTSQATTSGTTKDFTGIPSWAKRVTVVFNGVSTSSTSDILVQLGVGTTPTTSGYTGGQTVFSYVSGIINSTSTAGIPVYNNLATYAFYGSMVFHNVSGNLWVATGLFVNSGTYNSTISSGGAISLSGSLGMVRLTTASGTPTFDAGSANIFYE